jgi:hypothetical protein
MTTKPYDPWYWPELADYLASDPRLPFNQDGTVRHSPELDPK